MTIPASLITRINVTACQQGAFHLPTGQVIEEYFDEYLLAADRLGIITAQAHRRVPFLLPPLVADLVHVVVAHEDAAPKPAPDGVLYALDRLGVSAAWAMFVGDTANDMAAGRSAGVRTVGVGWGFVGPDTLRRAGADVVLTEPGQVGLGLLTHLDGRRAPNPVTG
jgi:phosphoglycolate phosphatase-like HAD superfamily hydrolase